MSMIVYTLLPTERHLKETLRPVERGTRSTPKGPECGCPDETIAKGELTSGLGRLHDSESSEPSRVHVYV